MLGARHLNKKHCIVITIVRIAGISELPVAVMKALSAQGLIMAATFWPIEA